MAALRNIRSVAGIAGPALSLALHFCVTLCYINRWDKATAVTVFPLWSWAIIGIAIIAFSWILLRNRFGVLVAAIWSVTALVGADEIPGILHSVQGKSLPTAHPTEDSGKRVLRVATINAKGRKMEAVREAQAFSPDIVLIQESPSGVSLNALAKEFFGEEGRSAGGWHCGIIARGDLKLVTNSNLPKPRFTHATLTLEDGRSIDLVSIHLRHAITRWDLWDRDCWETHYTNRRNRRVELLTILNLVESNHGGRPVIFGGDFNAPASDAVYNILRQQPQQFLDSYRTAGSGWGNTFFNRLPVLRIDQLWATPHLHPVNASAVATQHSDHRMLVCDYRVE